MIESILERIDITMYSVKEISEKLEVSRQTVYNYLKEHSSELKDYIVKKKGTTYITDEGLKLIKTYMGLIQVPTIQENEVTIDNIVENIKKGLMEEIRSENLKQEESINKLNIELKEIKEQNKRLIEIMEENKNKKGFLSRLFKR